LPSILIVDDYATIRTAVRARLETCSGFIVCGEAVDGTDAIEKARTLKPDVIVLDLAMPGMNGVEAASVLKGLLPHPLIVALTMYSESLGRSLAAAVGIDAVVAKSEGIGKVIECIEALLKLKLKPTLKNAE
jgi:DNA-binding NarL/FixJ family response regulator